MAEDMGHALDWDQAEADDSGSFELLEPGEYAFMVKGIRRERYEGGAKIGPCPRAVVEMLVTKPDGSGLAEMEESLLLHSKTEFRIAQFFKALGFRKDPETGRVPVRWNEVEGKEGRLRLGVRTFSKKDGGEGKANQVEEWIAAGAASPAPEAPAPQQGWSM